MPKLGIGKLTSPIMTSLRSQRHSLALIQEAEKGLKQVNGVLLKPRRGAFGKSVRRKLKKYCFSRTGSAFPEVSLPEWRALRPQAKKEGGKSWRYSVIRLSAGKAKKEGKLN